MRDTSALNLKLLPIKAINTALKFARKKLEIYGNISVNIRHPFDYYTVQNLRTKHTRKLDIMKRYQVSCENNKLEFKISGKIHYFLAFVGKAPLSPMNIPAVASTTAN